jgi:hypothetical protein
MADRLVLWASTAGPGGIHDLLLAVQQTPLWTQWNMRHIPTHRAGNTASKIAVFVRAAVVLAYALIRSRPSLVHLHAVHKRGSMFRNKTLARLCWAFAVPVIMEVHSIDSVEDFDWRHLDALYREVSAR